MFAIPLILFSLGCSNQQTPKAISGILDLSNFDFGKTSVPLDGEWEFYFETLLASQRTEIDFKQLEPRIVKVPSTWNKLNIRGKLAEGAGYASYKLKVLLPEKEEFLAIKILDSSSSYLLWINNKVVASNGRVGTSKDSYEPEFRPQVTFFKVGTSPIEIILEVSNFHHSKGGFWESIHIGRAKSITNLQLKKVGYDIFLVTSLFALSIFLLTYYILKEKISPILYASILSGLIAFRESLTGERLFLQYFPSLDWFLLFRFEYLSFFLAVTLFLYYLQRVFFETIPKFLFRTLFSIGLIFSSLALFLPTKFVSMLILPFQIYTILCIGIYLVLLSKDAIHSVPRAKPFLVGFLILGITIIHDLLYSYSIINSIHVSSLGILLCLAIQSYSIVNEISESNLKKSPSLISAIRTKYAST